MHPSSPKSKVSVRNSLVTSQFSCFPSWSGTIPDKFSSSVSRELEGTSPLRSSTAARIFPLVSSVEGKKIGTGTYADGG